MALSYVIWYSAGRFFIEGMRTDSLWIGDFLRVSQGLSLVLFVAALGVLVYRRYYTYPPVPYYKDEPKLSKAANQEGEDMLDRWQLINRDSGRIG